HPGCLHAPGRDRRDLPDPGTVHVREAGAGVAAEPARNPLVLPRINNSQLIWPSISSR
ncbi:MAG: hypothetical protein JWM17_1768, partial [Actinobacteria bacterium]|nr:hypothetical protein [Actinomycetota bacterium]